MTAKQLHALRDRRWRMVLCPVCRHIEPDDGLVNACANTNAHPTAELMVPVWVMLAPEELEASA